MKLNVYSVFDLKAASYSTPVFMVNDDVAIRSLLSVIRDSSSIMSQFPEDYVLHCLGFYDDETGAIGGSVPRLVVDCAEALSNAS